MILFCHTEQTFVINRESPVIGMAKKPDTGMLHGIDVGRRVGSGSPAAKNGVMHADQRIVKRVEQTVFEINIALVVQNVQFNAIEKGNAKTFPVRKQ